MQYNFKELSSLREAVPTPPPPPRKNGRDGSLPPVFPRGVGTASRRLRTLPSYDRPLFCFVLFFLGGGAGGAEGVHKKRKSEGLFGHCRCTMYKTPNKVKYVCIYNRSE